MDGDGGGDYGGSGGGGYGDSGGNYGSGGDNNQSSGFGGGFGNNDDGNDDHNKRTESFNHKNDFSKAPFGKDDDDDNDNFNDKYDDDDDDDRDKRQKRRYSEDENAITPYEADESTPDGALGVMLAGSLASSMADGIARKEKENGTKYFLSNIGKGAQRTDEEPVDNSCAIECLHVALTCCQCNIL